jgi:hypothetical protein
MRASSTASGGRVRRCERSWQSLRARR